ncbi:pancreatic lipase-related protein 2-like [Mercenaria mercenaria]|uniref:pancreatic lipase-related protein 2-like n=1 Tax=Mercenaria mercenaria TaxID=6596 RepID=UPI00234E6AFB|nr:pancreatic lipase-related protein 2-like [Mercenaria mercenaria]
MGSCGSHPRSGKAEVCYGELGCFTNEAPFNNTLDRLPKRFEVRFKLFTEKCKTSYELNTSTVPFISHPLHCSFDPALPLKFIVHGFRESGEDQWVRDVAAAIRKESMSVVTVDWKQGSGIPYNQAVANTRLVGAKISNMIKDLRAKYGVSPKKVHIIGFSLGAHIAGYDGRNLTDKIGRITELDPAEPAYKDTDPLVHLDKSDA